MTPRSRINYLDKLFILKNTCFAILFYFLSASLSSQQYNFINYSIEDGLAQSQVQSIFQDNKGYLWFGTFGGLTRYDGKYFVNYSRENGLPDNRINCIAADNKNRMWVGTQGGINRLDGIKTFKTYALKPAFSKSQVTALVADPKGNLWFSTDGSGVGKFDGRAFTYYNEKDGLINDYVRTVCPDANGNVWFGTRNGICFYDGKEFKRIDSTIVQPVNISQIIMDKDKHLWFCTYGEGVFNYDGDTFFNYTEKNGLVRNWIRSAAQDNAGNMWFASKSGVSKFNGRQFLNFNTENGLFYSNINTVVQDKEGNMWFGTDGKGALKFTGEAFVSYTTQEGLSNDIIMSIIEDNKHNLWFSSYGNGICKYDGKKFTNYTTENGISNNIVWTSAIDSKDNIWFGTSEGICKYDGKRFTSYGTKDGLGAKTVYSIFEDHRGLLWIGTTSGVSVFDGKYFKNYSFEENNIEKNVRTILEDKHNNLWFGTGNGIFKYDGAGFTGFTTADGLTDNNVVSILQDAENNFWIGTSNGISYFDGRSFSKISIDENYNSNYVNFMMLDDRMHLWIGTNNGIYELDATEYNKTKRAGFRHYTNFEGLRSLECNQNAAYKDSKGNLWFGTSEGVLRYTPSGEKTVDGSVREPMTHITGVRLFLQPTDWTRYTSQIDSVTRLPVNLSVDYRKNYFTFDYIGISLSNPGSVRYKFMLAGFDHDWSPPTDATFATYSNLPYGKYTFKVIAANKNNKWNEVPAVFSFEITVPFWMTWWFYLLCFIIATSLIWGIYRWRVSVIRSKHHTQQLEYQAKFLMLEHQTLNASMNRHFVFNALNSIQYYINKEDKISANKYLSSFAKLMRKNLDSSLSNFVPLSEEIERLELYLELELMRFENKFEYRINMDENIDTESIEIPPLLLQPYVENSIWHGILPLGKPGVIKISIRENEKNNIIIDIEDNGIGIEASMGKKQQKGQIHISRGMEITEARINLLKNMANSGISVNGPFDVKNEQNITIGTKVEIILP